jgi:hypothetical protein
MKESSKLPLFDLRKLNASLPVPSVPDNTTEILVMGASNDFIVVSEPSSTSLHIMMQYLASNLHFCSIFTDLILIIGST